LIVSQRTRKRFKSSGIGLHLHHANYDSAR
jgi:hypothetical protein